MRLFYKYLKVPRSHFNLICLPEIHKCSVVDERVRDGSATLH